MTAGDPGSASHARDLFESAVREAKAGRWHEAARAFAAAWRAAPERPEAAQGLLECAAHLLQVLLERDFFLGRAHRNRE